MKKWRIFLQFKCIITFIDCVSVNRVREEPKKKKRESLYVGFFFIGYDIYFLIRKIIFN